MQTTLMLVTAACQTHWGHWCRCLSEQKVVGCGQLSVGFKENALMIWVCLGAKKSPIDGCLLLHRWIFIVCCLIYSHYTVSDQDIPCVCLWRWSYWSGFIGLKLEPNKRLHYRQRIHLMMNKIHHDIGIVLELFETGLDIVRVHDFVKGLVWEADFADVVESLDKYVAEDTRELCVVLGGCVATDGGKIHGGPLSNVKEKSVCLAITDQIVLRHEEYVKDKQGNQRKQWNDKVILFFLVNCQCDVVHEWVVLVISQFFHFQV